MGINWYAVPLARITIAYAMGIGLGYAFGLELPYASLSIIGLCFAGTFFCKQRPDIRYGLVCIGWFISGCWALHWHSSLQKDDYFSKELSGEKIRVIGTAEETSPDKDHTRVLLNVEHILKEDTSLPASGKWMLWLEHDQDHPMHAVQVDAQLLVEAVPDKPRAAMNPGEFDYRYYLWSRDIHRSAYVNAQNWRVLNTAPSFDLFSFSRSVKVRMIEILNDCIATDESAAFTSALLLGHKDDLSRDIREQFRRAGASHVMAVSGLHVGIVYSIIFLILSLTQRVITLSKGVQTSVLILGVWSFAFICGLPASVCRASLMFSIWRLSKHTYASNQSFNAYFAAGFLLLWIEPNYLFQLGFQFSFLAVAGILLLYPSLRKLWIPGNRLVEYLWQIILISAAAQVFILPLTAYYFGYSTLLSLLSSLIVIPAAYLVLGLGLLLLITAGILPSIAELGGMVLDTVIRATIEGVEIIESIPYGQWNTDSMHTITVFIILAMLSVLVGLLLTKGKYYIRLGIALTAIIALCNCSFHFLDRRGRLLIYHADALQIEWHRLGRHLSIGSKIPNNQVDTFDLNPFEYNLRFSIRSDRTDHSLIIVQNDVLPIQKADQWLIDRAWPIEIPEQLKPDVLILPKHLSFTQRSAWVSFAEKRNIPCYDIRSRGAFIHKKLLSL